MESRQTLAKEIALRVRQELPGPYATDETVDETVFVLLDGMNPEQLAGLCDKILTYVCRVIANIFCN